MKARMGLVTLIVLTLTACSVPGISSDDSTATPSPESSSATSNDESGHKSGSDDGGGDEGEIDAETIVGDWASNDAEWTVHFQSDGTFVEDFQGFNDFRVGRYTVEDDTVTLVGDDGNSDAGTIEDGPALKFKLGTLTRED